MSVSLFPILQFFNATGTDPLAGGFIYTYIGGTTTPLATYTSSTGLTPLANPIVLDSGGRPNAGSGIWLTNGSNYKFVVKDSNLNTILTLDNVQNVPSAVAGSDRTYVTVSTDATLANSRSLGAGTGIAVTDNGAQSTIVISSKNVVNAQTLAYTALATDNGKFILYTGAGGVSLSLTAAATLANGWSCDIVNQSSGDITIDPNGAELVNGAATYVLKTGTSTGLYCNGTAFYLVGNVKAIGSEVQAWDADLDALAAISSSGLLARTGAGTASTRTITGTASQIVVANGDGVSGNPTLTLPAQVIHPSDTAAGSIGLLEASANGTNKVTIVAPANIASDKIQTLQDITGNIYVSTGTDVPVSDGGTGVSTFNTAYSIIAAGTTATGNLQNVAPSATTGIPLVSQGVSALPSFSTSVVAGGGTGVVTFNSAYSVVCAGTTATGNLQNVAPSATTGIPLVSQGASALPSFTTATVAGGGTGIVTTTAYGIITGGTTATGNLQNAGTGTAGQQLISGGSGALPTYSSKFVHSIPLGGSGQRFCAGCYPGIPITPTTNLGVGQNTGFLYFFPIYVPITGTYTNIGVNVSTAQASSNLVIGLYNCDLTTGLPTGAPITSSGALTLASTGEKTGGTPGTLNAGQYWIAATTDQAASSWKTYGFTNPTAGTMGFGFGTANFTAITTGYTQVFVYNTTLPTVGSLSVHFGSTLALIITN